MSFRYPAAANRMQRALEEKQGSALALGTLQLGKRECIYMGLTGHPNSGAISRPVDRTVIFDLASLTKVLVTIPLFVDAIAENRLHWDKSVQSYIAEFPRAEVQVRHLFEHRSGLAAHEEFYRRPTAAARGWIQPEEVRSWICESKITPLEQTQTIYSDLGILLVQFLLEQAFQAPLAQLFEDRIRRPLGLSRTGFRLLPHAPKSIQRLSLKGEPDQFVATARCPFHGRILQGEVDDNNCWGLGGATTHAGLFSTLEETLLLAEFTLAKAKKFHDFFFPSAQDRPPFTRGFMLYPGLRPTPTGEWRQAIGHTGFVGTSLWYHEPSQFFVVLLGNRVHPDRSDTRFVETRLEIHRALWENDLGLAL